jgi:hypothetical protein
MLVERVHTSSTDEKQPLDIILNTKDIGRVASATLFNTQLQLLPGRAKINGHNSLVDDADDINSLMRLNPHHGQLEVERHHSAHIAGMLEGHKAVREVNKREGKEIKDRTFIFIDVSGVVHRDMVLMDVKPKKRNRRLEHTAVFSYPNDDESSVPKLETLAIDDIYAIKFTPATEEEINLAKEESERRHQATLEVHAKRLSEAVET